MIIDRSQIGKSSSPQTFTVRIEAVRLFMEATGDPALQQNTPLHYAPPTFPTIFSMQVPGLELDGSKIQLLHREQEFTYARRLRIGEEVICVTRVVDVRERTMRGDSMTFVVLETTGVASEQQPVFTIHSTLVVRQK
jgi:hypothetical protein